MKKITAIVLAVLMLVSLVPFSVSASGISSFSLIDFNEDNNAWLFESDYGYMKSKEHYLETSLSADGEVLTVTAADLPASGPSPRFVIDILDWDIDPFVAGKESAGRAEFIKFRIKNNSPCTTFTMQFELAGKSIETSSFTTTSFPIDGNTDGFKEYIFSISEWNSNTNLGDQLVKDENTGIPISRWSGNIQKLAFFPFGAYISDGSGAFNGASMDIDYIVLGSREFCENYKSNLQSNEDKVTAIEIETLPDNITFIKGDTVDTKGLTLRATLDDESTSIIETGWAIDVDPTTEGNQNILSSAGDNITVKIIYGSATTEYSVSVKDITKMEILSTPTKKVYVISDNVVINTEGMVLQMTLTDGTTVERTSGWKLRYSVEAIGAQSISVLWNDELVGVINDIYAVEAYRLDIVAAPTKTEYETGNTRIYLAGLIVKIAYRGVPDEDVFSDEITYSTQTDRYFSYIPPEFTAPSESYPITIYYGRNEEQGIEGLSATFNVRVVAGATPPETTTNEQAETTTASSEATTTAPATSAPDATTAAPETTTAAESAKGNNTTLIIIIIVAVVVIGGGVACFFIFKKK